MHERCLIKPCSKIRRGSYETSVARTMTVYSSKFTLIRNLMKSHRQIAQDLIVTLSLFKCRRSYL